MPPYRVELAPAAACQLRRLDRRIQRRLFRRLKRLGIEPRPKTAPKLKGRKETFYRVREGNYRIIYTILDDRLLVLVVRIAHRSTVFR